MIIKDRRDFIRADELDQNRVRGLAIGEILDWFSGQNEEDVHLPFCAFPNGGEENDCSCGLAHALAQLERVRVITKAERESR